MGSFVAPVLKPEPPRLPQEISKAPYEPGTNWLAALGWGTVGLYQLDRIIHLTK